MFVPVEALAPVTPVCVTVHAYVVPATPPVKAILVVLPEHNDWLLGVAVTLGAGFTVTLTVCDVPKQEPPVDVGVTV